MFVNVNLAKAIAWMMGALLSFAAMAVSVRELSADMHAFEMLFIRSAIGVAVLVPILYFRRWQGARTARIGRHLFRNGIHFFGQVFWIWGIALLPLATVSAIEFTTPIWGAILVVLFLGERMNRGRWTSFALGVVGILIILRPDVKTGSEIVSVGALIMLACTFFFGATSAATKWLTRTESALTVLFYMVLIQTVFGAFASIFVWTPVRPGDWPMLGALSFTGLSAHYCLTRALAQADAIIVMPLDFLRLPLLAVVGLLLYGEPFELATLLGAAVIFSGNIYGVHYESRLRSRHQSTAPPQP